MPNPGDRREVPCSWCQRLVVEVYCNYPADTGIKGYFWDCSACPCGSASRLMNFADSPALRTIGTDGSGHGARRP
jgi:hypothetical protein